MKTTNALDENAVIENNSHYHKAASTTPHLFFHRNAYCKGVPMLHDLYLLSCYFDGPSAVMYEEDLKRRYGLHVVADALKQGLIELHRPHCARGKSTFFCRLSELGLSRIAG